MGEGRGEGSHHPFEDLKRATSKSAVSRISKFARFRGIDALPTWKSATQQVWKPALHDFCRSLQRDCIAQPRRNASTRITTLGVNTYSPHGKNIRPRQGKARHSVRAVRANP